MNRSLRFRNLTAELLEDRNMYTADIFAGVTGPILPQASMFSIGSQVKERPGDQAEFHPRMESRANHITHTSALQSIFDLPGPGAGRLDRFLGGLGPQVAYTNSHAVTAHLWVPMRLYFPTTILVIPITTSSSALTTVGNDSTFPLHVGRSSAPSSALESDSDPILIGLNMVDGILPSSGETKLLFTRRDPLTTHQLPRQPQLASDWPSSLSWYQSETANPGSTAHEWLFEDFDQEFESLDMNDLENPNALWQLDHHTIERLRSFTSTANFEPFTVNDNTAFLEIDFIREAIGDCWSRRDISLIEIADQIGPLYQRHRASALQDVIPQLDSMMGIHRVVDMIHTAVVSEHEVDSRESELNYQATPIEYGDASPSSGNIETSVLFVEGDRNHARFIRPAILSSILAGLVYQFALRRNKRPPTSSDGKAS